MRGGCSAGLPAVPVGREERPGLGVNGEEEEEVPSFIPIDLALYCFDDPRLRDKHNWAKGLASKWLYKLVPEPAVRYTDSSSIGNTETQSRSLCIQVWKGKRL